MNNTVPVKVTKMADIDTIIDKLLVVSTVELNNCRCAKQTLELPESVRWWQSKKCRIPLQPPSTRSTSRKSSSTQTCSALFRSSSQRVKDCTHCRRLTKSCVTDCRNRVDFKHHHDFGNYIKDYRKMNSTAPMTLDGVNGVQTDEIAQFEQRNVLIIKHLQHLNKSGSSQQQSGDHSSGNKQTSIAKKVKRTPSKRHKVVIPHNSQNVFIEESVTSLCLVGQKFGQNSKN